MAERHHTTSPTDEADDLGLDLLDPANAVLYLTASFVEARDTGDWSLLTTAALEVVDAQTGRAGEVTP